MRLLNAVTNNWGLGFYSGQLRFLANNGFECHTVTSPGAAVAPFEKHEGATVHLVSMVSDIHPLKDIVSLWRMWCAVRRIRPVLVDYGTPKAGLLCGLASWLAGVPNRVYKLRGLRLETATGLKWCVLWAAEKATCMTANRVICVSESLRRRAIQLRLVRPEKSTVLAFGSSNGVDVDKFAATQANLERAAELRKRFGLVPGDVVLGYVGRFTADKGVGELVDAFGELREHFPRLKLLMVGDFGLYDQWDTLQPRHKTAIRTDPRIVVTGATQEIAPYYLLIDMLVLPTYREGFPNTVLEAAAAGKPVITTTATGAIDAVVDGVTGIQVPAGSVTLLAAAIKELTNNPSVAKRMGEAGHDMAQSRFRQEIVWDALLNEYRMLMQATTVAAKALR